MNTDCEKKGHDVSEDGCSCRRCGVVAKDGFRLLSFPVRFLYGSAVCAYDEDDSLGWYGYNRDAPLQRPLAIGERVVTTALMGEVRLGKVTWANGTSARVEEGQNGMIWLPKWDRDERHGWTCAAFMNKDA
jgi:hypothetical protein